MDRKDLNHFENSKEFEDYRIEHQYLFNDPEFLSDKLKKYKKNSAQGDLDNEKSIFNAFIHSLAMARLSFNNGIAVFKLNNDVIDIIQNTSIDKLPNEIPSIFNKPFIIETQDIKKALFGDVNSIVCNELPIPENLNSLIDYNEATYKQILFHANSDKTSRQLIIDIQEHSEKNGIGFLYLGFNVFSWSPNLQKTNWKFNRKDYNRKTIDEIGYCDKCENGKACHEKANNSNKSKDFICFDGIFDNIISFLTVFSYLLDAENTPIQYKNSIEKIQYAKINKKKKIELKNEDWIIKYLHIDKARIRYENNQGGNQLDKEGLTKKEIKVKSHFRFQACGENYSKHKLIRIESFMSSKWVKTNDVKVIVSI